MRAFRKAVTAGAGLVLAVVTSGSALAAGPAQAVTTTSAVRTAAPAGASGAGLAATASHGPKGNHGGKGAGSGSGQTCTTDIIWGGYYSICFRIEGQGLRVETAKAWMVNNSLHDLYQGHFELIGPSGHILNCDDFSADTGHRSPDCTWEPHADVTAGRYCAKLWEFDDTPPGHWFQRGVNTCVDVHV